MTAARAGLTVARALGKVVVTVRGRLDATRTPMLAVLLEELSRTGGRLDVAIDLSHADGVDLDTVGVLKQVADDIAVRGGSLVVGGIAPEAESLITDNGLRLAPSRSRRRLARLAELAAAG